MKTVLLASLLLSLLLVPAIPSVEHQAFKPCCADGSSPWADESRDAFKSNSRAGYEGSELPPSSGYNPDHLDKYSYPALNNIYQREAPAPSGVSGTPPENWEIQPQRYGGEALR